MVPRALDPATTDQSSPPAAGRWLLPALLAVTAVTMGRALSGGYVFDDVPLILDNPVLRSFADPWAIVARPLWGGEYGYWRPLTSLALAAGNALGGAAGIHVLALTIHLGAVVAAHALARGLTGSRTQAAFVAAVFALHPVQVEGVAWAAAINDPLQGLLTLLCLGSALRWLRSGRDGVPLGVWAAFGCALLSKETGLLALPLVALLDRTVARPGRRGLLYGGMLAVVAAWWAARVAVFGAVDAGLGRAAADPAYAGLRLLTGAVEVLGRELALLVWPWPLTPFRDVAPVAEPTAVALALAAVAALAGAVTLAWRRRAHVALFGLGTVLVVLAPAALTFRSLGAHPVADRYLYLAVLGAALSCAPRGRRAATIAGAGLLVLFVPLCARQAGVWHDQERLVEHGLALDPASPTLRAMRGDAALVRFRAVRDPAELRRAETEYRRALALADSGAHPAQVQDTSVPQARLGLAWCELLGQGLQAEPRYEAALALFAQVTRESPSAEGLVGLGTAQALAGRSQQAERSLRRALDLAPDSAAAHHNLGHLYLLQERREEAAHHLQRAIALDPGDATARQWLEKLQRTANEPRVPR